ncbi:MAG: hypothetical protein OEZ68_18205 [Gammaproteobacteria bacterium]|nr:hypothetical protein [Gammaproteobacteria bacterium]MDH5802739.1 hypothetical protein [Gammaproteobacteria bacterium]
MGRLPITSTAVAFSLDGNSLYALDSSTLRKYDLSNPDINSVLPEIGTGVAISTPGSYPKMLLSADGGTVFLAGTSRVVIQPAF